MKEAFIPNYWDEVFVKFKFTLYIFDRYEAFDFHAECSKMRWDRLSILLDRLAHEQDELSMFLLTRDGTLVSTQEGVFRTNCIDCLDRTNVVQSMLAKRSLTNALQVCKIAL